MGAYCLTCGVEQTRPNLAARSVIAKVVCVFLLSFKLMIFGGDKERCPCRSDKSGFAARSWPAGSKAASRRRATGRDSRCARWATRCCRCCCHSALPANWAQPASPMPTASPARPARSTSTSTLRALRIRTGTWTT